MQFPSLANPFQLLPAPLDSRTQAVPGGSPETRGMPKEGKVESMVWQEWDSFPKVCLSALVKLFLLSKPTYNEELRN